MLDRLGRERILRRIELQASRAHDGILDALAILISSR